MKTSPATPFLKWAGGKQKIARGLIRNFPADFDRYYEPFLGGGSVLFALNPDRAIVGDANEWLLDTYKAVSEDLAGVVKILDRLPNTREEYIEVRSILPEELSLARKAAHFIYLNKTCFRGLFRVNRKGQFNVPYGQYDRRYYDPANLRAVSESLKNVEFRRGDFELCLHDISAGDFVYLDPPYYKLGGHADFDRYTKDKFRDNDHFRLAAFCRELDLKGIRWAMSNSDTEFVRSLFEGYNFIPVDNRREINLNSRKRNITELLVTNYEAPEHSASERLFDLTGLISPG